MPAPERGSKWINTKMLDMHFSREVYDVRNGYVRGMARWLVKGEQTHHSFTLKQSMWDDMVRRGEIVEVPDWRNADTMPID